MWLYQIIINHPDGVAYLLTFGETGQTGLKLHSSPWPGVCRQRQQHMSGAPRFDIVLGE